MTPCARKPVNIRYIHWAENSSQPMKFLGYIISPNIYNKYDKSNQYTKNGIQISLFILLTNNKKTISLHSLSL